MDLGLRGKVALVAAASKGLGRATAQELAAEGASVVICARGKEALDNARHEIASTTGSEIIAVTGDVSIEKDVDRIVDTAMQRFGRIDILVTNAGGPPSARFESLTSDMWRSAVDLTLMSVINLTSRIVPGMRERKWGRVINIASIAAKQPVEGLMLSNSIRSAVIGFARTLANEVATDGVTVNNILPGYTLTERVDQLSHATAQRDGITTEAALHKWEVEIPMRRLGEPREFGALAAFLASERASYITGQSVAVDGGWIRALL
ncbi:MAG TPA: SDR family oxidoreductase [Gemmatimonadaceae bacterium]|nr:SDR family oxidoreductase [Gemmatimonadaceae bacterium]